MLRITISNERQRRQLTHASGPLEFGRGPKKELERFIIEDRFVSRDQLRIEETDDGQIRLNNTGGPVTLSDGATIGRGTSQTMSLPLRLTVGYTLIEITNDSPDITGSEDLRTISRPLQSVGTGHCETINSLGKSPPPERLTEWFETLLTVQTAAAGSGEFYQETARAVVNLVGLDRGVVALKKDDQWHVVAKHRAEGAGESGPEYSRRVLHQVEQQKRTFYEGFDESAWQQSLVGVESVVASPIFDGRNEVVGVVYGSRNLRAATARRGIQPLEAQVVQLLAGAVSAGLARLENEAKAARIRVQFEQFCSPEIARALEQNPDFLKKRYERTVTVLFCDLRGFSRISERLGHTMCADLLSDAMDPITERIIDHGGIIVDYAGDGIVAMWNAPEDQANHEELACDAARAMQQDMPKLNAKWADQVGSPIRLGVGLNTGPAQVGNAGSERRLKYGPRGHTVNLAARVEGDTKKFGVPILITGPTRDKLSTRFATRRLCNVRVVGINDPVPLYELCSGEADECWTALRTGYEKRFNDLGVGQVARGAQLD